MSDTKQEVSIEEMNKSICQFMGGYKSRGQINFYVGPDGFEHESGAYLKYHTSWDWLMPVAAKIPELIHAQEDIDFRKEMTRRYAPIRNELCNFYLSGVHYCVYQFIQWFNKTQQQ